MFAIARNFVSTFTDIKGDIDKIAEEALHVTLDVAADAAYAPYYVSYEGQRWLNNHVPAPIADLAVPFTATSQATGLAGDVAIDFIKEHTVSPEEKINDEGLGGTDGVEHNACLPSTDMCWTKVPTWMHQDGYLPGFRKSDGKVDFALWSGFPMRW